MANAGATEFKVGVKSYIGWLKQVKDDPQNSNRIQCRHKPCMFQKASTVTIGLLAYCRTLFDPIMYSTLLKSLQALAYYIHSMNIL